MMRTIVLAGIVLAATGAGCQSFQASSAEVTDFGIYQADNAEVTLHESGVKYHLQTNERLIEKTAIVPLRQGVTFGYRYILSGPRTQDPVPVRQITIYPSGGVVVPGQVRIHRVEQDTAVQVGDSGLIVYNLDDAWELAPGTWTLEVRSGNRLLASRSFTLVAQ